MKCSRIVAGIVFSLLIVVIGDASFEGMTTERLGYIAKSFPELTDEQRQHTGEFLQTLEDHDDVHRVWAAIK